MGRKSQKDRKWKAETDKLRTAPSQRFIEKHEERTWSPKSGSKKSDTGSSASEKGSPLSTRKKRKKDRTRNRIPAIGIDGTVSSRERSNTIAARDGVSASGKDGTVSNRERRDTFSFGTRDEYEDVPLQALERMKAKHEGLKASEELDREDAAHEDLARQFFTIRTRRGNLPQNRKPAPKITDDQFRTDHGNFSEIRHSPDHRSELRPSESEQLDGSNDESHPKPSLTSVPNEGDNRQSHIEQMKRYTTENYPENHAKHKNRSPESPLQDPDPEYGSPDDEGVIRKDFGSWNPPNQQESHDDPQPHSPNPDHSIDETSDQENQAVPDLSQKPEETETLSKTPLPSHNKERDSLDSQPQESGSGPSFVDADPIHDSDEEQVELGINMNDEAPDSPHSPQKANARPIDSPVKEQVAENESQDFQHTFPGNSVFTFVQPDFVGSGHVRSPISQLGSPGIGHSEDPYSQSSPAPNDQTESTDSQPQSATKEEVVNWLDNDQVLPSNYYDVFPKSPKSPSPKRSSRSSSYAESIHTGSPIVSQILPVRLPCFK